jgi:hypothetical protein
MVPMVLHTAVLLAATREAETCPRFDFFWLANLSQSVYKSQNRDSYAGKAAFSSTPFGSTFTARQDSV